MRGRVARTFAHTSLMLSVAAAAAAEPVAQQRAPVPDVKAMEAARAMARQIYAIRFQQATSAADKTTLAREMIGRSLKFDDGSADQYVMLKIAGDVAAGAGDAVTATDATEQMVKRFDVPAAKLKADSLLVAASRATESTQHKAVAELAVSVAVALADEGEYDTAIKLCVAARSSAQKAKQPALVNDLTTKADGFREQQKAAGVYREAVAILDNNPTEPGANLTAGCYLCFVQENWEKGLPKLALGSDAGLKATAVMDLRGGASPEEQVALGDAWWSVAENKQGQERNALQLRAGFWYRQAQGNLPGGLVKMKVDHRIQLVPKIRSDEMPAALSLPASDAFACRKAPLKTELLKKLGGSDASEAAVAAALQWIADHQLPDGGWCFDHRPGPIVNGRPRISDHPGTYAQARNGATAMAVLPFLGAGHTHKEGKYGDVVKGAIDYLVGHMKPDGSMLESQGTMYAHGLASIALCEAFAMTGDTQLKAAAQDSLKFVAKAQDPVGGGWRYSPRQPGDTSVFGWQMMAIKTGDAAQVRANPVTMRLADKFLDTVQANRGSFYGYTSPGQGPSTTAIGLLCRMYMGWKKDNEALRRGVQWLSNQGPSVGNGANMYYNYYGSQVCRQYGDKVWDKWNSKMRDFLVASQSKQGPSQGSWFFAGGHGAEAGGRLYNTSLATMILEVYYRHMPIY